tara:strand:+ start:1121 stop:1456 length:336 start_codon:yes stop_codon:yes gene_type:complete
MSEVKWPETDARISNIGPNGNTGEHYDYVGPAQMPRLEDLNTPHESPADRQVGGSHYKRHSIQPWDIIDEYGLGFYEGNVLKYLLRDKGNKREDLEKAVHYLEKIIEGLDK